MEEDTHASSGDLEVKLSDNKVDATVMGSTSHFQLIVLDVAFHKIKMHIFVFLKKKKCISLFDILKAAVSARKFGWVVSWRKLA